MEVRDLKQYIEALCGQETLDRLGSNEELLLQKIYGQDPNPGQVKSVISDAASFASNAEEQLFYEFVQNAYDANADSLFFYANEDYLIVLNNGEPFYTDFDIFNGGEGVRDGQLYSFLSKGKSAKRNDAGKLGKYGQGSKLLYTLLTDVSESIENEDLLIDALYEDKKGPYLISWNNRNQLANLLLKQSRWTPAQGDDYKNNILFAKILMSYYPIAPGRSEELFSTQEALAAVDAFDTLVDPRRNLHFLNRGTALIIPLGKGKYEKITSKDNLERVRTRLGGFASITKEQERNEGKTVEHIYVLGEEIEQHEVKSVFVEFQVDGKPFFYHFAFNPVFADKNFVNLFKGLPILETKLRLGFIIDSQKFDVDSSRQRISDKEKTKGQLIRAFSELVAMLVKLKDEEPEKFDYIYRAIAATRIPDGDDFDYIRKSFLEVFTPFFNKYVLTNTGVYNSVNDVRYFTDDYVIPLDRIGVTKYKFVDKSIKSNLSRHKVNIEAVDLATVLADSDSNKLEQWIKSLSPIEYAEFHKLIDTHKEEDGIFDVNLFRSNKGELYSFDELQDDIHIYYPYEEGMKFGECEHITEVLTNLDLGKYAGILFEKIKKNISSFRLTDSTKDDAANLLAWIVKNVPTFENKVKTDIELLQNWHGEYVNFENLLSKRPDDTILFDNYCAKGYVPEAVNENNWLLNPTKAKTACWKWLTNHWNDIQSKEEWGKNTHRYIADIKTVYKACGVQIADNERLSLYIDEAAKPTQALKAIVNNVSKLSQEEYDYLGQKVHHLQLLPYDYVRDLQEMPFQVQTVQSSHIVNDGLIADKKLLGIFIKITDSFLYNYKTKEVNGGYEVTQKTYGYNYTDRVSSDLEEELLVADFYRVPNYVQQILNSESARYRFSSNEDMLKKAIERVANPIKLLSLVKQANANVRSHFFAHLGTINIDDKLLKEDLRWQVIEFAANSSDNDHDYVADVFENIHHKNTCLPDSITQQFVKIGNNEYDVYDLDESYKNDNQFIDSFLDCLPSETEIEFFKNKFYDGKENAVDVELLYSELSKRYLTIEQLKFCIDYALTNDDDCDDLEIDTDIDVIAALDMIVQNNFQGFDKHFIIPDVDLEQQIYANPELLLQDEILPQNIQQWLDKNPNTISLFTRLVTLSSPHVAIRESLLNGMQSADVDAFVGCSNSSIDSVIEWAISKDLDYVYGTNRYYTIMDIIEKLPSDFSIMPFLRYTGNVEKDSDSQKLRPTFKLERFQEEGQFLSYYSWNGDLLAERMEKSRNLRKFFQDSIVYLFGEKDVIFNHNLKRYPRLNLLTAIDPMAFPEHSDPVYLKWKTMPESKGISIHTSSNPIEMNLNVMSGDTNIFSDKLRDSEYGYKPDKCVVIQYPNNEGLSLMKAIAKHISSINFFKEPFIALQSLYVDQFELLQQDNTGEGGGTNLDLTNSTLNEEQAQEALNKITNETAENLEQVNELTKQMTPDDLEKLNESAEPIKDLMNTLGKDDIDRLAAHRDKLMQMLDDIDEAEDEEKESQVRQTIGFIGELIYAKYLENKGKQYIHAALEGIGDYDFEVTSDNMFVDVKTTLYSLKDGTAPFYLHRSQNSFMQLHPDSLYHIVRISLIDLNLKKSYEEVRDTYGKDANPMENSHLRKRCEEIAKKYWRGAKIEEFDALSPEYKISIEKK
jgi:hypothetical protein